MKIYNNQKAGQKDGHYLNEWCDAIEKGDYIINGTGTKHICTGTSRNNKDGVELVWIVETKKDGTAHLNRKGIDYIKWNGFWERLKLRK